MSARGLAERGLAAFQAGDEAKGVQLIGRAAREGDANAQLRVARWRLWGLHGPRDFRAAHRLLNAAAAKGNAEAKTQRAVLLGNGTGAVRDWGAAMRLLDEAALRDPDAAAQRDRLAAMRLTADGDPVEPPGVRRPLSERPAVEMIEGLFGREECDWIVRKSEPLVKPSLVTDERTGQRVLHPVRRSEGMNFGPPIEDLVVQALVRRLAAASGTDVACGEPLYVLRYGPGHEYRPHFDVLPGEENQREVTILVWLNEGYQGGETVFTETGLTVRGLTGDALVFRNLDADGRPDPLARHAGAPVTAGVKRLASRWIRCRPFSPWE